MKVLIASDHAGYHLKLKIKEYLEKQQEINIEAVEDFGTHSETSMDYPDVVHPLCQSLKDHPAEELGILLCGSGNGVCMTANKYTHIRAALCWSIEITQLARQHNNANILCIPARFVNEDIAIQMVKTFLITPFEGGRHENRIKKISC